MKVVYLVSYPRSGNTWLRFLLYNYIWADLKHSSQVENAIPDLHHLETQGKLLNLIENDDQFTIVKSHYQYFEDYPYIEKAIGFIYLVRNPRDITMSSFRTFNRYTEEVVNDIQYCGLPKNSRRFTGNWTNHICSWLKAKNKIPGLFIKYEDLRENPEKVLRRVIEFIGLSVEESRIANAINLSRIELMKNMEINEEKDKNSILSHPGIHFINEGKSNQPLEEVSYDIDKAYRKEFSGVAGLFGYA